MSQNLIKQVNINGLEYNKFRDPNNYRKAPGEDYRFKIRLNGSGTATARLEIDDQIICEEQVTLPGIFSCTTKFETPGARPAFLTVETDSEKETRDLTIHIWEHPKRDTKEEVPSHH
ncbi:hypothetical protein [Thiohalorhabdus methylotrophus]|uniref:Uncharacterized protein n=1 Tax=Thiohalorhabdus methylotrophus TaxID=3242694 RepID=A0ABV4TUT6_9GAMM